MCMNSNVFLFLLLICLVLMLLLFHAQEPKREEGGISPSLITHISYKWMLFTQLQCKEYQCPEVGRFPQTPCLAGEKCGTQAKVCWFPSQGSVPPECNNLLLSFQTCFSPRWTNGSKLNDGFILVWFDGSIYELAECIKWFAGDFLHTYYGP